MVVDNLNLKIDQLLLDQDNPRIGTVGNQSEALGALLKLSSDHFKQLMLSIKENGLDPGDSLYVIKAENTNDFVVLEGNRRLSALKVMAQPDLLTGIDV